MKLDDYDAYVASSESEDIDEDKESARNNLRAALLGGDDSEDDNDYQALQRGKGDEEDDEFFVDGELVFSTWLVLMCLYNRQTNKTQRR
jgi:hypothetical protein